MTYQQAIQYLGTFFNYEDISSYAYDEVFGLERIEELLALFGHPENKFNSLHIAGTKGKGSVAAMLFSILTEAGFKAGLYTSPHLSDFKERIRIAEDKSWRTVSEEEIVYLLGELKPRVDSLKVKPSLFELYTALAFLYFARMHIAFAVVETGLGGRLDATNTLKALVCGITSISLEHTDKLGSSLSRIAQEKCGIIKDNSIVISAPQQEEVEQIIKDTCAEKNAIFYEVSRNIFFEEVGFDMHREVFNIKGIFDEYPCLEMPLLGEHQLINASLALGIVESLRNYEIYISHKAIREGLRKVYWPGRLETVNSRPLMVLDGAQNRASSSVLKEALKKYFKYDRLILILGISKDKDIGGICKELSELADEIILTKARNPRAAGAELISNKLQEAGCRCKIYSTGNTQEAINLAREKTKEEDLILVTGSLFVVGEAREIISKGSYLTNK